MHRRWLGAVVLAALVVHAISMGRANLPHLLWSCHVASATLAVGMLVGRRAPVAAGFLFHLAIGFPAWATEMIATGGRFGALELTPHILVTSTLAHVLPLLTAALWLWPPRLPRSAPWWAWLIQVGMVPVARRLTPPEFNINLSHAAYEPLRATFSSWLAFQAVASLVTLGSVVLFYGALSRRFPAPPAPDH